MGRDPQHRGRHLALWSAADPSGLIDLAVDLDAPLLYLDRYELDQQAADERRDRANEFLSLWRMQNKQSPDHDPGLPAVVAVRLDRFTSHTGEAWFVRVAFALHGVVHAWHGQAGWYTDLVQELQSAIDAVAEDTHRESVDRRRQAEDDARVLTGDEEFCRQRNRRGKERARAEELLPGADGARIRMAMNEAGRAYPTDAQRRFEANWAALTHEMLADGVPFTAAARRIGVADTRLRNLLAEHSAPE